MKMSSVEVPLKLMLLLLPLLMVHWSRRAGANWTALIQENALVVAAGYFRRYSDR